MTSKTDSRTQGSEPFAPTRLFLIRHGEVAGDGVLHGHVDVPLTGRGIAQMEAVADRLGGELLSAVYCSDLQRARVGAEIVARSRSIPVIADPAFRELDMGRWDGRPMADIWREEKSLLEAWWADLEGFVTPGGESLGQLRERVLAALDSLLDRHRGEPVCLVAHGGVTRVILFEALGMPLGHFHRIAQEYGCFNHVDYFPDGTVVVRLVNG